MPNGGFPPIKYINKDNKSKKEDKDNKEFKKERFFAPQVNNLNIRNILSDSIVKPMIQLDKNRIEVIESL